MALTNIEILPEPCPSQRGKRKTILAFLGVAATLSLLGILTYGVLGTEPLKSSAPADSSVVTVVCPGRTENEGEKGGGTPDREAAARIDLERAREDGRSHPGDLPRQIDRLTGVALAWDGTSAGDEAHEESELLRGRLLAGIRQELEQVDRDVDAMTLREEFGKAVDLLTLTKALHSYPAWTFEVDRRIQRVESHARELLIPLVEKACEARRRGAETEVQDLRGRVAGWGCPTFLDEIDRALPAVGVRLPVPSPEARAYREQWERAWIDASWGDFSGAERRIRNAAAALREPGLVREAGQDLQDIVLMAALGRLVDGLLSSASPGARLDLVASRASKRPGMILDPVYQAHADGLEFKKAGQDRPYFVAFDELDWPSRIVEARKITRGKEEFDARARALLCLLSGNAASARSVTAGLKTPLLEKHAAFGEGPQPFSEGSASAFARHSREAGRLFHDADWQFRFLATHASAVLQYRTLLGDYGTTPVVQRDKDLIQRRSELAREYVFRAQELLAKGTFDLAPWRSRGQVLDPCWISRDDVDGPESRDNYVEILFSPLPGVRYRCWVYAGGCCYESFTCYFQTTGYSTTPPDAKEPISLEPGGNFALPLRPPVFLRETHLAHARRNETKKPARWAWIEVPLPEYSDSGLKRIRLISDQKGFAVGCAVVSSTREKPPTPDDLREWTKNDTPEPALGGTHPVEWLLLGPFHNRGFGSTDIPEEEPVDITSPISTKLGLRSWTVELARPLAADGGTVAVFDFTTVLNPHEEVVVFALSHVWSPADVEVALLFGSDDGSKVWLNGDLIHQVNRGRGVKIDEDRIETRLKAGWNRFLVKVYQGKGGWGLAFRLTDREGKPIPGLLYDSYGDLAGVLQ